MKISGFMKRLTFLDLSPLGAVSPIRIVSLPWPVACRPVQAASEQLAVQRGGALEERLALALQVGVSQPEWFGSFQIDQ